MVLHEKLYPSQLVRRIEPKLANTYPYISAQSGLIKAVELFRKSFPATVDSAYLKRMQIAPGNESYLINILRFLGLIDEAGGKVEDAANAFFGGEDHFKTGFSALVLKAYAPVFDELGADAWNSTRESLTHWFRMVDKTTELIGQRQSGTFLTLAGLTGHGSLVEPQQATQTAQRPKKKPSEKQRAEGPDKNANPTAPLGSGKQYEAAGSKDATSSSSIGLSVRVEVNVPVGATAAEYDAMFASIRKHLYPS